MAKARGATVDTLVKLIVGAGQASPSPPVGPALGSKGIKSMDFCKVRPKRSHFQSCSLWLVLERLSKLHLECSHLVCTDYLEGIQRKNITYQPRHTAAGPSNRPARPIIPLRCANSTDLMAATQCSRGTDGQKGKEERRLAARPRGCGNGQLEAHLRDCKDQAK